MARDCIGSPGESINDIFLQKMFLKEIVAMANQV
jgi:hypothetical protein